MLENKIKLMTHKSKLIKLVDILKYAEDFRVLSAVIKCHHRSVLYCENLIGITTAEKSRVKKTKKSLIGFRESRASHLLRKSLTTRFV